MRLSCARVKPRTDYISVFVLFGRIGKDAAETVFDFILGKIYFLRHQNQNSLSLTVDLGLSFLIPARCLLRTKPSSSIFIAS